MVQEGMGRSQQWQRHVLRGNGEQNLKRASNRQQLQLVVMCILRGQWGTLTRATTQGHTHANSDV